MPDKPAPSTRNAIVSSKSIITLLFCVSISYVVVLGIMMPLSDGVHGKIYTDSEDIIYLSFDPSGTNNYTGEVPQSGTYSGTALIHEGSGWLFCNGKVQRLGPYRIENANFTYDATYHRNIPDLDNGAIEISGKGGELTSGMPVSVFATMGIPLGIVIWLIWEIVGRRQVDSTYVSSIGAGAAIIIMELFYASDSICYSCVLIYLVIDAALFLYASRKNEKFIEIIQSEKYSKSAYNWPAMNIVVSSILFGYLLDSVFMVTRSAPTGIYNSTKEFQFFVIGYMGLVFSLMTLCWGIIMVMKISQWARYSERNKEMK